MYSAKFNPMSVVLIVMNFSVAGDTAEIVSKTRKEKRKEKKKLLKRKKQEAAVKEISSTPSGNTRYYELTLSLVLCKGVIVYVALLCTCEK